MFARSAKIVLPALLTAALLAGCGAGDVIDPEKAQIALQYDVETATGEKVESVTCPSDVPASVGTRFTCHVVAKSGDDAVAELEVTTEKGDLKVLSLNAP